MKPKMHVVIPDCQVRPGVPVDHLRWVGNYIETKRPDVLVCLGDFADMPSLSQYSVGQVDAEGKRYRDDIAAAKNAMATLLAPVKHRPGRMLLTLGNHEDRIEREANANPKWAGSVGSNDLGYERHGWSVVPFLKVARVDNIEYAHYFTSGVKGNPVSSAAALLRVRHSSAVMGHVQLVDMAIHAKTQHIGLFAGICYQHDEGYLGPQGNSTKRGIWVLNEVREGTFDPMFVSLGFLKRRYS